MLRLAGRRVAAEPRVAASEARKARRSIGGACLGGGAGGGAVCGGGGKEVGIVWPERPTTGGGVPVAHPPVKSDSAVRPAAYPHQDVIVDLALAAGSHEFTLVAVIGGKGLM